jgi:hypothetical protein
MATKGRGISRPCVQIAPVCAHFSDLRDWLAEGVRFELSDDFQTASEAS